MSWSWNAYVPSTVNLCALSRHTLVGSCVRTHRPPRRPPSSPHRRHHHCHRHDHHHQPIPWKHENEKKKYEMPPLGTKECNTLPQKRNNVSE
jgi:hypothetical protein